MSVKRVLIVEDHEDNAHAIADFIQFIFPQWKVEITSKGRHALDLMISEPVDVLVLDIALADEVNGLDVIKRLWESEITHKPRIIITTAMGNKAFRGPRVGRKRWVRGGRSDPGRRVRGTRRRHASVCPFLVASRGAG